MKLRVSRALHRAVYHAAPELSTMDSMELYCLWSFDLLSSHGAANRANKYVNKLSWLRYPRRSDVAIFSEPAVQTFHGELKLPNCPQSANDQPGRHE